MSGDGRPRVAVIGHLSFDRIRAPDGTESDTLGGAALYASLGVLAAGGVPVLVAAAGSDMPADALAKLAILGVDLSGIERRNHPTRRVRLSYADAETRTSPHWRDPAWWDATWALAPPAPFGRFDATLMCAMPAADVRRCLAAAIAPGPVVLDTTGAFASADRDGLIALLPRLALFAPSLDESRMLCPGLSDDQALEALARLTAAVVQKRGAAGLVLKRGDRAAVTMRPSPVRAVETTGAGDAVAGALATGLALGLADADLLALATDVAARAVRAPGPSGLGFDGAIAGA